MAVTSIEDVRKQYPQYNDMSDLDLAKGLHQRYYSDMPLEEFTSKIGVEYKEPEAPVAPATMGQRAEDILISGGRGVLSGLQAISDSFGVDNKASQAIKGADTYLADLLSAQAKKDDQEIARIIADAKDKGVWENIKAGLSALSVAPARNVTNALGQAAPFALAALTSELSVPIGIAAEGALGVATGLGATKDKIYNEVKQGLIDNGVNPDDAEKTAHQAQSYDGENLDQIITGGLVGAGAMAIGPAGMLGKRLAGRILKTGAEEAEAGFVGRAAAGAAKGAGAMGVQGAQGQIAANIAQQREGLETPTFAGVTGEATQAAITGGLLGGLTEGFLARQSHPVHEDLAAQDKELREAVTLYNQDRNADVPQSPMLLLEDQTGNRVLEFADQHRDSIPVLGYILDSNAPRDIKIDLIKKKIGESFEFSPNPPVPVTGRIALPAPEKGSVAPHEAYNMLVDEGVTLDDLRYEKTPGGNMRLMSGDEKVLTAPIRFRSEREANVLIEALRKENDLRKEADYEDVSKEYKDKRKSAMTAALAGAAREINSPFYPVKLTDVERLNPKLAQDVRISRQREGAENVDAPATMDELRHRGADRETLDKLAVEQKPITGGSDRIRPEYEEEVLGPRPLEPVPTARTEEELGAMELPEVTGGEEAARRVYKKGKGSKKNKQIEEPVDQPVEEPIKQPVEEPIVATGRRPVRPEYPVLPKQEPPARPDPEALSKAKDVIQSRLDRVRGSTEQGRIISDSLQKALDGGEFTPEQMVTAFNAADVSARLLGKTASDPHAFEFVNRVMFGSGEAYGKRVPPSEKVRGLVQLALRERAEGERGNVSRTASHEAFHVLQDILAKYDPAGSRIIKESFSGAKSFDDINPSLLSKLKLIKDPTTGDSLYDMMKRDVPQTIFDDLGSNQAQRERELQAYVFEHLDDAMSKGAKMTGLGNAFTRLLNYVRDFKDRFGNLLKGQGFVNAEDVLRQVSRGERQAGLGEEGVRVTKDKSTGTELSSAKKSPDTKGFMKEFTESTGDHPFDNYSRILGRTTVELSPFGKDTIHLSDIRSLEPKSGAGTEAIKYLTELADAYNVKIQGDAKAYLNDKKYVTSSKKLADWYKKNGFKIGRGNEDEGYPITYSPKVSSEEEFSRAAAQVGENVKEFEKWWGDSKATDETGKIVPWYSGTHGLNEKGEPFKVFSKARSGSSPVMRLGRMTGPFFFSRNPEFASQFGLRNLSAREMQGKDIEAGRVIPAFLSSQNPFDYENKEHLATILKDKDLAFDVRQGRVSPGLIGTGDWRSIEHPSVQRAIRNSGYDGFFVKEHIDIKEPTYNKEKGTMGVKFPPRIKTIEEKNLAVFDPKQIKGVFNEFKPGTAESAEFSKAIKKTGQEEEAKVNSKRFKDISDRVREFFDPFANIKSVDVLRRFRNLLTGSVTQSETYAREMSDRIAKASPADREAVYKFMTTRNADAATIKDQRVREAAMKAKKSINDFAKQLVERKELTQESLDLYYDKYLPRLYMYFELTGRGMKTPLGGVSAQEYLKNRNNELTEEERSILGEIKDPAFLTYVALSRPARDMAMRDYLNNLNFYGGDKEHQWIAPKSYVEWRGKKMTPFDLETQGMDMLSIVKDVERLDPKQAGVMRNEAVKMIEAAKEAMREINPLVKDFEAKGYKKMPENRRYGPLAGAIVQKGIYNDLVGTFIPLGKDNMSFAERLLGDENSKLVQWTQLWKLGKTTLNPPTQATNFISNAIALNLFGGVPITSFPRLFRRALEEMANNGKMYQDAKRYGIQGSTMSSAELRAALNRLKAYQAKRGDENSIITMFAGARAIASSFAEKSADLYQSSETLYKMMKYVHDIEAAGPNPSEKAKSAAVDAANSALFDYSLVNPNIRWLRSAPIGLPFITYYYKALPKLVETMVKHPFRFAPYVLLAQALPMSVMGSFDLSNDELEKLRKSAADYIRDKGSLFFLPMRDSKGNIEMMDFGRFFPFSAFFDPIITALKYGEPVKALKDFGQTINPSGPVVVAFTAVNSGIDPFTNKPIMDPRDSNKAQALSLMSYIWNQAMPPALNVDLNNMDHSGGAIPRLYNAMTDEGTGKEKRGLPRPELIESAARLFGANITPLKPDLQRAQNMIFMQNQIVKSQSLRTQIMNDQSMTYETKKARIDDINEKIKDDMAKLQAYATETSGVDSIAKRIKEKQ
jgi:hypothetical protein